jgi:16S rRNA (guanine527-N7)-methyltransferase
VASSASRPEPPPLSLEALGQALNVSRETNERLATYGRLLEKWNPAINLVSRDSLADLWRRHFLDSAQLAELIPSDRPLTILDMGSGAGFPGLVLTILASEGSKPWTVHLAESDKRKAVFLATVARETGAAPIIHTDRVEQLAPLGADLVTARALAPLDKLVAFAARHLKTGGECLFLKGIGLADELTETHKIWKMTVDRWPSRSSDSGIILRLRDISRV